MGRILAAGGPGGGSLNQPVVCHSPVLQNPRCKGKEGIKRGAGAPGGQQQREPQGRHWLAAHGLASLGPASHPLCPKAAQHGWQLS